MPQVQANQPAPDIRLPDFTGKTFELSSYRNSKNVILVFNRGFM